VQPRPCHRNPRACCRGERTISGSRRELFLCYTSLSIYLSAREPTLVFTPNARAAMALRFHHNVSLTEAEHKLLELRRLILAKEYTRRYSEFLCSDAQLIAILAADGDAPLRDMLAGAGVPLLHRKHLAGFVREAQSMYEVGPAEMDPEAAACAAKTEASGSGDEMDVAGDAEASGDGVQGVDDAVVGSCSSESVREFSSEDLVASSDNLAARSDELVASREAASSEVASSDVASSDEVIPAPKARLFCASSFGGEAWSLFRANPNPDPKTNPNPNPNPNPNAQPQPQP
jgi:hypothetical protein